MIEDTEVSDVNTQDVQEMFGDKPVRWYQSAARHAVEKHLQNNPAARILVALPTGVGKTVTSGLIFSSARLKRILGVENRNLRLLFIAHRHRLLTQAEAAYASAEGVDFIAHSTMSDLPSTTDVDIICIDEAHSEATISVQYHLDKIGDKPIIGLTATPDRPDGFLIKFEHIVAPISRQDAVKQGFLAETSVNTFVDPSGVNKCIILKEILDQHIHKMGQTLVFTKTRKEASEINDYIRSKGYSSEALLDQSNDEVEDILNAFSDKKGQFIVNCSKLKEGIDLRGCTDVVIGRQLGSYVALNQIIGRAALPDSSCTVWELVNPMSSTNLETTAIVGTPKEHMLHYKKSGAWCSQQFDYVGDKKGI